MGGPPTVGLMLATVAGPDTGAVNPARVVQAARRAEETGYDGVYVGDHLLHPHPMLESVVAPADQGAGYLEQVDALAREVLPQVRAFSR